MTAGSRGSDQEAAQELRRRVKSAGGALRIPAPELAACFGRPELRGGHREAIAHALGEAGVRSDPRLDREDPASEHVDLSVRKARAWRPDPNRATPAWVVALLGLVAVGLGAGAALIVEGGEESSTRTIRETVEGPGGTSTVTRREERTVTETETETTTVTTTIFTTREDPPRPEPEIRPPGIAR